MHASWSEVFSLFIWIFLSLFVYVVTNCPCIGTYLDQRFCISLSFSLSVSGYIIGNLRVCEQSQSARPVCNSAIEKKNPFLFCVYTYVSWFVFLSFFFDVNACTSFRLTLTHCMSIYVSGSCLFLSFSLNICNNDRLYYHPYVHLFFFHFFSLTCIHPLQFLSLSPPPPPLIHISKVKYEEEKKKKKKKKRHTHTPTHIYKTERRKKKKKKKKKDHGNEYNSQDY